MILTIMIIVINNNNNNNNNEDRLNLAKHYMKNQPSENILYT